MLDTSFWLALRYTGPLYHWGYWHLRTRRSDSHSKLCTIFEAYREIAAFVISQYTLEQASSRTKRIFGIHWRLSNVFFYVVHPRIWSYQLLPSLASARKTTFGSAVSCKWTRQLCHLESINSSGRLNWGLFRHSISYMTSLWRHNTTDTHTLHMINNVCYAVAGGRKILPEVSTL